MALSPLAVAAQHSADGCLDFQATHRTAFDMSRRVPDLKKKINEKTTLKPEKVGITNKGIVNIYFVKLKKTNETFHNLEENVIYQTMSINTSIASLLSLTLRIFLFSFDFEVIAVCKQDNQHDNGGNNQADAHHLIHLQER